MDERELVADFVGRRMWAVVGATNDREKYGNTVYRVLRERGYHVYPVHVTEETVEGDRAYKDVRDLPPGVEVLSIVIPAARATPVLEAAKEAGISRVWFQPGAESAAVLARADALGLQVVAGGPCAMVNARHWEE